MSKKFVIIILFAIIIMAVSIPFLNYKSTVKHPFVSNKDTIRFTVKDGDSLSNLINNLSNQKVIGSKLFIKWYIKNHNLNTTIKPGSYAFLSNISLEKLIESLNTGKFSDFAIKVTIPEGYDINQIAALLQQKNVISKEQFIQSVKNYALPDYIKKDSKRKYSLEGYLFPDTYEFTKGMKGDQVIDIMLNNFERVMKDIEDKNNLNIKAEDTDKIINMASIVEREAQKENERAMIAGVFYNRLKIGMQLQSCATVEYALGVHKDKLYNNDLKINSPYNTYLVKALPEGPICSPGRLSIEAAIMPEKTKNIYFVSKNDGTHFFTDDYKKFLEVKKATQGD